MDWRHNPKLYHLNEGDRQTKVHPISFYAPHPVIAVMAAFLVAPLLTVYDVNGEIPLKPSDIPMEGVIGMGYKDIQATLRSFRLSRHHGLTCRNAKDFWDPYTAIVKHARLMGKLNAHNIQIIQ